MKAVAAMSLNRVIGRDGAIPWHLPEDFKWFKQLTSGHLVIMGRKTFDSLPKPLPNRTNIVVTRKASELSHDQGFVAKCGQFPVVEDWAGRLQSGANLIAADGAAPREVWLVESLDQLVAALEKHSPVRELFVIGGSEIYGQLLPRCSDVYISQVMREVEGDAFFPEFESEFDLVDVPLHTPDFEVRHFRRKR
jgi:dihydrofolate reductase